MSKLKLINNEAPGLSQEEKDDKVVRCHYQVVVDNAKKVWDHLATMMYNIDSPSYSLTILVHLMNFMLLQKRTIMKMGKQADVSEAGTPQFIFMSDAMRLMKVMQEVCKTILHMPNHFKLAVLEELLHWTDNEIYGLLKMFPNVQPLTQQPLRRPVI